MSAHFPRALAYPGFADGFNWNGLPDFGTNQPPSTDDTSYGDTFSDLVRTLPQKGVSPHL